MQSVSSVVFDRTCSSPSNYEAHGCLLLDDDLATSRLVIQKDVALVQENRAGRFDFHPEE